MVQVLADRDYAEASVEAVCARARVSRRTFHRMFASREACFCAVLDEGAARVTALVSDAFVRADSCFDGIRGALGALLMLLDRERVLARVWLIRSLAAGPRVLEHREKKLGELLSVIVSSCPNPDARNVPPLGPQGSFASVLGIVASRLFVEDDEPLIALFGPLMGLAVAPYSDRQTSAREVEWGSRLADAVQASNHSKLAGWPGRTAEGADISARTGVSSARPPAVASQVSPALKNPNAYRARECLLYIAAHPDASNREIATGIGVAHDSQVSRLLGYLLSRNLVLKHSQGVGKRNSWRLSEHGAGAVTAGAQRTGGLLDTAPDT